MESKESTSVKAATGDGKLRHTTRKDNTIQEITATEATTPQSTTQELQTDGTISTKSVTANIMGSAKHFTRQLIKKLNICHF